MNESISFILLFPYLHDGIVKGDEGCEEVKVTACENKCKEDLTLS